MGVGGPRLEEFSCFIGLAQLDPEDNQLHNQCRLGQEDNYYACIDGAEVVVLAELAGEVGLGGSAGDGVGSNAESEVLLDHDEDSGWYRHDKGEEGQGEQ